MAYLKGSVSYEEWMTQSDAEGHTFPSPETMMVAREMLDLGYSSEEIDEESIEYYLNHD